MRCLTNRLLAPLALAAVPLALAGCAFAPPTSPVITGLTHRQTLDRSAATDALLFVCFTADWCEPCRRMTRETWPDPRISRWLKDHGSTVYAVAFEPGPAAESLGVRSIPVLIAYRRAVEVDRLPSARSADEVLEWFGLLAAGSTRADSLAHTVSRLSGSGTSAEAHARLALAETLIGSGRTAEATPHLQWLWANRGLLAAPAEPAETGTLLLTGLIARAAESDPAYRRALAPRRDDPDVDAALGLSAAIGDAAALADWFCSLDNPADRRDTIAAHRDALWRALIEQRRYPDAVRLVELFVPAPTYARNRLRQDDPVRAMLAPADRDGLLRIARSEVADLHAALLASNREAEAMDVAALLLRDTAHAAESRIALVRAACRAGFIAPAHRQWLVEARRAGLDTQELESRLETGCLQSDPRSTP